MGYFLCYFHPQLDNKNLLMLIIENGNNQLFDIACKLVSESKHSFTHFLVSNIIGSLLRKDDKEKIDIFFQYQWDLTGYFVMYDLLDTLDVDENDYWKLSVKYPWIAKDYQQHEWRSYQKNPDKIVEYWVKREKASLTGYYYNDNLLTTIFSLLSDQSELYL